MLDLKINHLQLLAQIVSTGSLTEAAQNLGLSAAAASRMLKKLHFAHFRFAQQKLQQKIFSNTMEQRIFMGMPKHGHPKMNMTASISV